MGHIEQSFKTASKKGGMLAFITAVPIFLYGNFGYEERRLQ
jgi:hypothetical protein